MKKYVIVAYPESDEGYLPRQEKIVEARDSEEALYKGWRLFPEYHQVGAFEVEDQLKKSV